MTMIVNPYQFLSSTIKGYAKTSNLTTSSTATMTLPTYAVGDLLVLVMATGSTSATIVPSGWTQSFSGTFGILKGVVFYKVADGSEGSSLVISMGVSTYYAGVIYSITAGSFVSAPVVQTTTLNDNNWASNLPNPPSQTPTGGNGKYLTIAAYTARGTIFPTGYPYTGGDTTLSGGPNGSTGSAVECSFCTNIATGTTFDPGTFTVTESSSSHSCINYTVTVKLN